MSILKIVQFFKIFIQMIDLIARNSFFVFRSSPKVFYNKVMQGACYLLIRKCNLWNNHEWVKPTLACHIDVNLHSIRTSKLTPCTLLLLVRSCVEFALNPSLLISQRKRVKNHTVHIIVLIAANAIAFTFKISWLRKRRV